jgi:hypothetical protein
MTVASIQHQVAPLLAWHPPPPPQIILHMHDRVHERKRVTIMIMMIVLNIMELLSNLHCDLSAQRTRKFFRKGTVTSVANLDSTDPWITK